MVFRFAADSGVFVLSGSTGGLSGNMLRMGLLNVVLRALSLGSKFVLLFFMAKYLSAIDVGVYGLLSGSIGFGLYLLGMDFYVFNTREILSCEEGKRSKLLRDQFVFHLLTYSVLLPFVLGVFWLQILPWEYVVWLCLLLVLEHLSQELYRVLITLSESVKANTILFLRSGAWVFPVLFMFALREEDRGLTTVWMSWTLGAGTSVMLAAKYLRVVEWNVGASIDWQWVWKGVRVALPFLGGSLGIRGIFLLDRYMLQHYWGDSSVGVYTFYMNIANLIQVFVDTGVVAILLPKLITTYQTSNEREYVRQFLRFSRALSGISVLLTTLAVPGIYLLLWVLGRVEYEQHLSAFWISLLANMIAALGLIPHYDLYIRRRDFLILVTTGAGFFASVFANVLLVPRFGLLGASGATLVAMTVILVGKLWARFQKFPLITNSSEAS